MAEMEGDGGLDDFFAKKDKSKKKTKTKSLTPAEILSAGGETKKISKTKKSKAEKAQAKEDSNEKKKEDDEWRDVNEESKVDYSDLKIQSMSIRHEQQQAEVARVKEVKLEADIRENREGGPWNASGATPGQEATGAPPPAPEPTPAAPAPASTSGYVPPAMRAGGAGTVAQPGLRRKKKEAPNITSEMDFPTLGGGAPAPTGAWGRQHAEGFEEVVAGRQQARSGSGAAQSLEIGNRYDALSSEH